MFYKKFYYSGIKYSLLIVLILVGLFVVPAPQARAACQQLSTSLGQTSIVVNVPTDGTYVLWSKIMIPDTEHSSFYLQVDNSICDIVVNGSSAPTNTWTWVNGLGESTKNKIILNLKAGTHTFVLTGKEPGVKVDELLLLADHSCVPTGLGQNCIASAKTGSGTSSAVFTCLGACPTATPSASLSASSSPSNPITAPSNGGSQTDFFILLRDFFNSFLFVVSSPI